MFGRKQGRKWRSGNAAMFTKNFARSMIMLCTPNTKYYSKRCVHRQLLSRMFPQHGIDFASSSALATGCLSYKASSRNAAAAFQSM